MNRNEALAKAYTNQLLAYLLAGVAFTVIQVFDSKLRVKYKNRKLIVFIVQTSKGIIPLSLLSTLLGQSGNLGEKVIIWLVVVITIYLFVLPGYLFYRLYQRFFKKNK